MAAFMNSDGQLVRFGRSQGLRGAKTAVTTDTTKTNEMVMTIDLAGVARTLYSTDRNNDNTNDGFSGLDTPIPAGSKILSVDVITVVTPAGGTSYQVGTYTLTGTAVDDDGILTTAGAAGAQIGTQASQDLYVTAKTVGTYTAGQVKVVIKYMIR